MDDGDVLTAKQVKERQKRNEQLEEENLILKKRLPSSCHAQTKTRCHSQTSFPTHHLNSLLGPKGQQKHLLQTFFC